MLMFALYLVLNEKKLMRQQLDEIFGMLFGGCQGAMFMVDGSGFILLFC